jgi:hypothetical protein
MFEISSGSSDGGKNYPKTTISDLYSCASAVGQFQLKNKFIFGYFSMYLKLVPKKSAGVVPTFYVSTNLQSMKLVRYHWFKNFISLPRQIDVTVIGIL